MLRKFGIIAVLSLLALALAAVPALAVTNFNNAPSGAHYRQGSAEPVCTLERTDLRLPVLGLKSQVWGTQTRPRLWRLPRRSPALVRTLARRTRPSSRSRNPKLLPLRTSFYRIG